MVVQQSKTFQAAFGVALKTKSDEDLTVGECASIQDQKCSAVHRRVGVPSINQFWLSAEHGHQ